MLTRDAHPLLDAVKDAQRTKTTPATRRTLSVIWGTSALADRSERTLAWYRALLQEIGTDTQLV